MIIKCEECHKELNVKKDTIMKMCSCGYMNEIFIQVEGGGKR